MRTHTHTHDLIYLMYPDVLICSPSCQWPGNLDLRLMLPPLGPPPPPPPDLWSGCRTPAFAGGINAPRGPCWPTLVFWSLLPCELKWKSWSSWRLWRSWRVFPARVWNPTSPSWRASRRRPKRRLWWPWTSSTPRAPTVTSTAWIRSRTSSSSPG